MTRSLSTLVAGALLLLIGGGMLASSVLGHLEARQQWSVQSELLANEDPSYDPERSDRYYIEAEERLGSVSVWSPITLSGVLLLSLFFESRMSRRDLSRDKPATPLRVLLGTVLDGLLILLTWIGFAELLGELQPLVLRTALSGALPVILLSMLAIPLGAGATPGLAFVRIRVAASGGLRPGPFAALVASFFAPAAAALSLPPLFVSLLRHSAVIGPHLSFVGLHAVRDKPSRAKR